MMTVNRPVLLVNDGDVLDEVLRTAAAVGCEVDRVADARALVPCWSTAPLIVLDPASVEACVELDPPRRDGVVVLGRGQQSTRWWRCAVNLGVERVLRTGESGQWLINAFAEILESPGEQSGRVLSVLGARGGAGASVLAAAVGISAARRGLGALLVDCDPLGGGVDLLLGAEDTIGLRWPDVGVRSGRVAATSLHAALPTAPYGGGLTVLSCDRDGSGPAAEAIAPVLDAGRRAGEIVVCDLPRQLSPAATAALTRTDLAVVGLPSEVRSCVAARRVLESVTGLGVPARLVVRGPSPGGLTIADVEESVEIPVLTSMTPQARLARQVDAGLGAWPRRGPLMRAARRVLDELCRVDSRMVAA